MRAYNQFRGSSSSNSVLWGGLANFSALIGEKTLVALNNTFNRSSDNEARQSRGTLDDYGFETLRSSLGFIERTVRSNQLHVQRTTTGGQELSATFTSSAVSRREPDRSELEYVREPDPQTGAPLPFALFSYNPEGARRTFSNLDESSLSSSLDYRIPLGSLGDAATLRFGGAFRRTQRDADNSSYSILGYGLTRSQREAPAEEIFGTQNNGQSSKFTVLLNSTGGSYSANDRVSAGYGMIDLPIGDRVKVIAGARVERADIEVRSFATTGERSNANLVNTDILPSLVANVSLTPAQSIRLSVSQTVSRPEYRELSPVTYRDVVAQQDIFGNPDLKRSLIRNFDARWEWFPGAGEILGFGLFAKKFANPIERVDVATSGASRVSFINADGAVNYGLEMELRKRIGSSDTGADPLSVFTNATLMKSSIDISSDRLSSLTNRKRAMVGQAPYVVNAGLTWAAGSGKTTTTLLYNLVGRRITAAGSTPLPDTYETARGSLDLSFQTPLLRGISARFDAKNLLDSPYETRQGPVVRESYRAGRVVSFGLKWQQ
jgi:TonB-dependent receptor